MYFYTINTFPQNDFFTSTMLILNLVYVQQISHDFNLTSNFLTSYRYVEERCLVFNLLEHFLGSALIDFDTKIVRNNYMCNSYLKISFKNQFSTKN